MILNRLVVVLIVSFTSYSSSVIGQINQRAEPYSFKTNLKNINGTDVVLSTNLTVLRTEQIDNGKIEEIKENNRSTDKLFQFAYGFDADADLKIMGVQDSLDIGLLYRLIVRSDDAFSINLVFKKFKLPKGAKLFLYNVDKSHVLGAFTSNNNKESERLPVLPVRGDEIIVEYFEPYYTEFEGEITIGKINHDFLDFFNLRRINYGDRSSGACNVNINCAAGNDWQTEKRAVCKIIKSNDGSFLSTGTLLNNTNLDGKPYLLTAFHSVTNQSQADDCIFIFNYESSTCAGQVGSVSQSIAGATVRAGRNESDFTLLELSLAPLSTWNPHYAGWDNRNNIANNVVGIHHPSGDVKKICLEIDNIISTEPELTAMDNNANYWMVENWDIGVTEGGSSGSALFNSNHLVIGQLYGGDAACDGSTDNNLPDWYGKLSTSWGDGVDQTERLREWLNPDNSRVAFAGANVCPQGTVNDIDLNITHTIVGGVVEIYQVAEIITASNVVSSGATVNYKAGEEVILQPGFIGDNGSEFVAEIVPYEHCVPGCLPMSLSVINYLFSSGGNLCFEQTNADSYSITVVNNSGTIVHQNFGSANNFQICEPMPNSIGAGNYIVTLTLLTNCEELTEVYSVTNLGQTNIIIQNDSSISQSNDTEGLFEFLHSENSLEKIDFQVYPNPSTGSFLIQIEGHREGEYSLEIINSLGSTVYRIPSFEGSVLKIKESSLTSGVYFLRIDSGKSMTIKKIIVN